MDFEKGSDATPDFVSRVGIALTSETQHTPAYFKLFPLLLKTTWTDNRAWRT